LIFFLKNANKKTTHTKDLIMSLLRNIFKWPNPFSPPQRPPEKEKSIELIEILNNKLSKPINSTAESLGILHIAQQITDMKSQKKPISSQHMTALRNVVNLLKTSPLTWSVSSVFSNLFKGGERLTTNFLNMVINHSLSSPYALGTEILKKLESKEAAPPQKAPADYEAQLPSKKTASSSSPELGRDSDLTSEESPPSSSPDSLKSLSKSDSSQESTKSSSPNSESGSEGTSPPSSFSAERPADSAEREKPREDYTFIPIHPEKISPSRPPQKTILPEKKRLLTASRDVALKSHEINTLCNEIALSATGNSPPQYHIRNLQKTTSKTLQSFIEALQISNPECYAIFESGLSATADALSLDSPQVEINSDLDTPEEISSQLEALTDLLTKHGQIDDSAFDEEQKRVVLDADLILLSEIKLRLEQLLHAAHNIKKTDIIKKDICKQINEVDFAIALKLLETVKRCTKNQDPFSDFYVEPAEVRSLPKTEEENIIEICNKILQGAEETVDFSELTKKINLFLEKNKDSQDTNLKLALETCSLLAGSLVAKIKKNLPVQNKEELKSTLQQISKKQEDLMKTVLVHPSEKNQPSNNPIKRFIEVRQELKDLLHSAKNVNESESIQKNIAQNIRTIDLSIADKLKTLLSPQKDPNPSIYQITPVAMKAIASVCKNIMSKIKRTPLSPEATDFSNLRSRLKALSLKPVFLNSEPARHLLTAFTSLEVSLDNSRLLGLREFQRLSPEDKTKKLGKLANSLDDLENNIYNPSLDITEEIKGTSLEFALYGANLQKLSDLREAVKLFLNKNTPSSEHDRTLALDYIDRIDYAIAYELEAAMQSSIE
jgi:hypothetical protein